MAEEKRFTFMTTHQRCRVNVFPKGKPRYAARFVNGMFTTTDPDIAQAMRDHRSRLYTELSSKVAEIVNAPISAPDETVRKAKVKAEVTSITDLIGKTGIDPSKNSDNVNEQPVVVPVKTVAAEVAAEVVPEEEDVIVDLTAEFEDGPSEEQIAANIAAEHAMTAAMWTLEELNELPFIQLKNILKENHPGVKAQGRKTSDYVKTIIAAQDALKG